MKLTTINLCIINIISIIILLFAANLANAGKTTEVTGYNKNMDVVGNMENPEVGYDGDETKLQDPNDNILTFSGTITGYSGVYGSMAIVKTDSFTSSNNTLNITGQNSSIINAYGAYAEAKTTDGNWTGTVTVKLNTVNVYGGTFKGELVAGYATTYEDGSTEALRNNLNIHGGEMKIASAGYSFSLGGNASANYNTAKIYGGEITQIYGGNATGYGSPQASADGNVVTVIGGIVKGIFGGFSNADGESTANGNTVEIGGEAKIETVVYGGCVMGNGTTKAKATGNTVTISGAPTMDQAALYGGFAEDATGDIITDNTLNLKTSGLKVAGIYNFSNLNFFLPASMAAGDTVIEVRDNGKPGSGTANIVGSTVNVGVMGTASPLEVGDEVILIDADSLVGAPNNTSADGKGTQGVSLLYEFSLSTTTPNQLKATVTNKTVNDGVKALAEGSAAGMGLLLVADGLPESAAVALDQGGIGVRGGVLPEATIWRVFSAFGGGRERIETGSHVDLSAFTASLGVARRFHTGPVDLVAGLFFEYGVGSYETYNRFPGGATVRGEGDLKFAGGGALIALDRLQAGPGYFRFELSGRAGRVENDYSSRDLRAADGTMASYRTSSPYWGLRLGAAYLFDVTDTTSAEVYARWAFTRQGGGTARLSTGEKIVFEDADSSRIKAGFRVSRRFGEKVEIYAGAAWENELQGAAKSSVFGYSIDPPTMRGHTGVAEAGLRLKPSADGPLSLDLGLEGRAGKRRGLSGHMTIKLEF